MGFRFPNLKAIAISQIVLRAATVRISSRRRQLRSLSIESFGELAFAGQKIVCETVESRDRIFLIFFLFRLDQKIPDGIGRGASHCEENYARTRFRALDH